MLADSASITSVSSTKATKDEKSPMLKCLFPGCKYEGLKKNVDTHFRHHHGREPPKYTRRFSGKTLRMGMKLCRACRRNINYSGWTNHKKTKEHKREYARWEKEEVYIRKSNRQRTCDDPFGSEECLADFEKKG